MFDWLHSSLLTPGVIDKAAVTAFTSGACQALALALHGATGWPIIAIRETRDPAAKSSVVLHWLVRRPDGMVIDINGAHTEDDVLTQYRSVSSLTVTAEAAPPAECAQRYNAWLRKDIPPALVKTFVSPVLATAA